MHVAIDETGVCRVSTGDAFRERFGNPYAVIHRADAHRSLLEGAEASDRVRVVTGTTFNVSSRSVTVWLCSTARRISIVAAP